MNVSRKNSLYGILLGLVVGVSCDTPDSVDPLYEQYFTKYYGEDGNQEGKDFVVNSDGTIIMLGNTYQSETSYKMFVVKTDMEGNVIWEKRLGVNEEKGQDIEPIVAGPDAGNFVVLSSVKRNLLDSMDIRLTIIQPNGDSIRSVLFNLYESQEGKSVTAFSDGSYMISGFVLNSDTLNVDLPGLIDRNDILKIKYSSNLVLEQASRTGGSSVGSAVKAFDKVQSQYFGEYSDELDINIAGDVTYESNFVFRNLNLTTSTQKTFYAGTTNLNEFLIGVGESPSGIYMGVGTQISGTGSSRLYATTIVGNYLAIQDQNTIGPDNLEGVAVAPLGLNRFLVLGNKIEPGGRNIWLASVDLNLATEFEVFFGGANNDDTGSAVAELSNGDILVLGTMNLTNQNKIALIKLRSNGHF